MSDVPNPIDKVVGSRVRRRRHLLNVEAEIFAGKIGITVMQLQRYEDGFDRIDANHMRDIAKALEVNPISFFLNGSASDTDELKTREETVSVANVLPFVQKSEKPDIND